MTTATQVQSPFIKLSNGDVMRKNLIGSCSHYRDHGIMLLNTNGEKLLWIPEVDNTKAQTMRDEIVNVLIS
ncbi:hypothetical protein Q4Q52_13580 [Shewanella sp. SP1S2-4]|uniref:hypothetical protein n=1 Tax=Shewanella sp. SP1S2-4 TaxID=3063537 RepID=UPI00288E2DE3|nr:hypothetical protein [Shewanella sp. SP1S2-4]MDT3320784.1 hypothetical protein [Shewanella sp. SP1S2-4]